MSDDAPLDPAERDALGAVIALVVAEGEDAVRAALDAATDSSPVLLLSAFASLTRWLLDTVTEATGLDADRLLSTLGQAVAQDGAA